jgi:glycosyltransferase involved in cell wall biosynthesis
MIAVFLLVKNSVIFGVDRTSRYSMNKQPLVSVGIPTYNRPEELALALKLVTEQTYENLEIIISDNGSSDEIAVANVVRSFSDDDSRIKFYRQDFNKGSIFNFEFVMQKATGEYFLWAADDDEIEAEYIEKLQAALSMNNNSVFAVSGYDVVDKMQDPVILTNFTEHLFELRGKDGYSRMLSYVKQPDYYGKSRILWGLHRTSILTRTFRETYIGLEVKADLTWAELPVELRLLAKGDLTIVPEVLFHVNLLPSSEGLKEGSKFKNREIEMCRRAFDSYRRAVESATDLSQTQKSYLVRILNTQELHAKVRMVSFGIVRRYFPSLARILKKFWMKVHA